MDQAARLQPAALQTASPASKGTGVSVIRLPDATLSAANRAQCRCPSCILGYTLPSLSVEVWILFAYVEVLDSSSLKYQAAQKVELCVSA